MAKRKKIITHLSCESCSERNYTQVVSKKRTPGSLKLKKFCSKCKAHQAHKESK